jgi:hypothetical protein
VLAVKLGISDAKTQKWAKQGASFTKTILHHDGGGNGFGVTNFAHSGNAASTI